MQNWLVILLFILGFFVFVAAVSLITGMILLRAGKKAKQKFVSEDSEKIASALPGKDCGKCGYPTCAAYAEYLASVLSLPDACHEDGKSSDEIERVVSARKTLLASGDKKKDRYYPD